MSDSLVQLKAQLTEAAASLFAELDYHNPPAIAQRVVARQSYCILVALAAERELGRQAGREEAAQELEAEAHNCEEGQCFYHCDGLRLGADLIRAARGVPVEAAEETK